MDIVLIWTRIVVVHIQHAVPDLIHDIRTDTRLTISDGTILVSDIVGPWIITAFHFGIHEKEELVRDDGTTEGKTGLHER